VSGPVEGASFGNGAVIGRSPRFSNVVFAFGHGHYGMMMSARTGEIVAALLAERDPGLDMSPYWVERF